MGEMWVVSFTQKRACADLVELVGGNLAQLKVWKVRMYVQTRGVGWGGVGSELS